MKVKIYIETSLAGPCSPKEGYYAVLIEYQTQKGPATIGFAGMEEETTYHRSTLLGIVLALQKLKDSCEAVIYTHCTFIKGMYEQGKLEQWEREEWKKSTGEEVKNKKLWQQFFDEVKRMGGHDKITFRYSKHNDYRKLLKQKIEEKREEVKKNDVKF